MNTSEDSLLNEQNKDTINLVPKPNSAFEINNGFEDFKACTIFRNFSVPVENKSLVEISKWIASNKFKTEIEEIQSLITQGKTEEAQEKKQRLPAFTPSATFEQKRLFTNIVEYNRFVHLDFDKLTPDQLEKIFQIISKNPYTFLCFRSPSGNGLKLFVEVNSGKEHHEIAYSQVKLYYENATGLKADNKCKDITRLCFMSYDPNLYLNSDFQKFEVNFKTEGNLHQRIIEPQPEEIEENDYETLFQDCIGFTEQKKTYTEGNRNDFIYTLASNCNRCGIPEKIALQYALTNYNLPANEIDASFRSAYAHHKGEFAKFANLAKLQTEEQLQPVEDFLKNTPSIPEALYLQMPQIIREGAMVFSDFRERDVFLTGALAILSGCLPGVIGVYAGQEVYPNLFSFAIAPAASGKGALKFAKMLVDEYHNFVLKTSRDEETKFNQELSDHKQKICNKRKGDHTTEELPTKPPFKVIYIPANSSYAKILWHLEQNEGSGIICETEADTLGKVFLQEWGSYSDMLRKSFHNEKISSSRKQNNEFIEVDSPYLSVALSGTPNQVAGLIASAEDGLFSRFVFYSFKVEQKWKDVSPTANNINLTEHFKNLSRQVFQLVNFLQTEKTEICLTSEQWQKLNYQCDLWLNDITMFTGDEAASIVKRLGLIMYRISMLFTAMRKFENAEVETQMDCTDEDFNTALQLVEVYQQHSILMFNNLPKQGESTQFKKGDRKQKFIEALPKEFTTKQAVEIGKKFGLSYSLVTHYLPVQVPKLFSQSKAGYYIKNHD